MTGLDIGVYGARAVPSTYSGYETFLTTLLPALAERGHRVTMYCRRDDEVDSTPWRGVERRVLPSLPGKNTSTLTHGLVASVAARRAGHDVVFAVNVANAAYTALGRITGQPTILNTDGQEWKRGKWGGLARRVFRGSARIAGRCATGLVADCAAMRTVYLDEFGADSSVVPYCAPTIEWTPDPATPAAYGVEHDRYLLIAGRHNPENNIDRIAQALTRSSIDLPLLVLGTANYDSPVAARLRDLARRDERIRVVGHVGSRPEFLDLIHHAAVYLHGHSVGGINPSLVEAMYARARVAALDTPFNREVLGPAGDFFELEPSTFEPVLRSLLDECETDRQRRRAGAAERIAREYAVDRVVEAYEAVFAAAVGRRAPGLVVATPWSHPH